LGLRCARPNRLEVVAEVEEVVEQRLRLDRVLLRDFTSSCAIRAAEEVMSSSC
jgi:hypothetical protein